MPDSYLSPAELLFLRELVQHKVRFIVVGMSAAVLQGSDRGTEDIDLWFGSQSDPGIDLAARAAGGIFAWRANPPMILGKNLDHIDIIWKCDGLGTFEQEYANTIKGNIFGVPVRALSLERVIVSKEAAGRQKDLAAIPSLKATLVARNKFSRHKEG